MINRTVILFFIVLYWANFTGALKFVKKQFQRPYLQVHTYNGIVQGTRLKSDYLSSGYYYAYMGIPYAQPPLGPLRFRAPVSPKNWSNVLDGRREGAYCVGIDIEIENRTIKTDIIGSEDCLFLNVFNSQNPKNAERLKSVMVFLHGGGFMSGSSNVSQLGADLLASEDVIVVTLNYRLGILGFLSTEDMASPGNYGLKDQNMALQWVQQNIHHFGGDPGSVTIFGQSAGAASVHFHILSPKSKGLFHKAIMESGTALCTWSNQRSPRNMAYLVGLANGIINSRNTYELVERLRGIPLADFKISIAASTLAMIAASLKMGLPTAPSIEPQHEEAFLSHEYLYEMLNAGDFNRVPIMLGVNANESLFFIKVIELVKPFLMVFDIDPSLAVPSSMNISNQISALEIGKMISDFYLGPDGSFWNVDSITLMKFLSHDVYTRPIRKTAILMAKYVPVYFYHFSYQGYLGANGIHQLGQHKNIQGVAHEEELGYLFNKFGNKSKRKSDYTVRNNMLKLWTNFAKYGNPTPREESRLSNLIWPTVLPMQRSSLKHLDINEILTVRNVMNEQVYINWWENIFNMYAVPPLRTY
ncbi:hypothetical protein WA026_000580 [Henosepilachna vigintioctopunctata]|uniref:Carboxylic ester hydrolase n=1 Tax=Henosepilachna vigintioctopunctata TaxID=420089 RepID=A0AAW1V6F9_9CUCU